MNLRTLAAFVIGLTAAGAVSAQSVTLRARIPFSFVVNGETLPAGEYTVRQAQSQGTMLIRGVDHSAGAIALVIPKFAPTGRQDTARLVFNGYGDQYFLSQIWTDGNQGNQVPVTRAEHELIARRNRPNQAVVAVLR